MANRTLISRWVSRWHRDVRRFVGSRVRDPAEVEDLAQEVYLRVLRMRDLGEIRNPQAYLIGIARHVISDWRLRARQSKVHDNDCLDSLVDNKTPDLDLEYSLSQRRFDDALSTLGAMGRAVIILRGRDGLTHDQIAGRLDISPRQARRYLARAYTELRKHLQPDDMQILSRPE